MADTATELATERVDDGNFEDFLSLIDRLAEYEKLSPPDPEARERLRRDGLGDRPLYEAYLGRLGGESVAYAIFFTTYSSFLARPTLYLEDIFVLEEHRRSGVGRKMFDLCARRAGELNCRRMEWCVLDWNEPAQRFYESMGAQRLNWYFYRMEHDRFKERG